MKRNSLNPSENIKGNKANRILFTFVFRYYFFQDFSLAHSNDSFLLSLIHVYACNMYANVHVILSYLLKKMSISYMFAYSLLHI